MKNLRCLTGIKELDNILNGGLPARRFYLIQGDPGVGKTTLALQFLLQGVAQNEKVLYITLSESEEEINVIAQSHGWSLNAVKIIDLSAIEENLSIEKQNTLFHPSEMELKQTIKLILDNVNEFKPARVVFDSLAEIRLLAQNSFRYRRQMLGLKQYFSKLNSTVLLLDDRTSGKEDLQIQSIAHGVITLEKNTSTYGTNRRLLHVDKIRGSTFQEGHHDFVILKGGLSVFPRLLSKQNKKEFPVETVSTGIKEFDTLLGGGIERGTSNLFLGPPGVGKSTLAMRTALTLAEQGERVAIYCFDENFRTYVGRAAALGMDLNKYIKNGTVLIKQISVSELSPGEFAYQIKQIVENNDIRMIVIDSLNGYMNAMTEESHLIVQLHELFAYLNHQGVISILIVTNQGLFNNAMSAPVEATYLADTAVVLRFFEALGSVKKAISIIKKRSSAVEDTIREFKIDRQGLHIGPPLVQFRGVLTGNPTYFGEDEKIFKEIAK